MNNYKYSLSLLAIASFAVLLLAAQAQADGVCTTSGVSEICLFKEASPNPATLGQPLTFTLTESVGTSNDTVGFTSPLTDNLPPGLIFVSVTNNGGSNGAAPPCTFTPSANLATSSGTVSCPAPRQVTGPNTPNPGNPARPFIATINVIPNQPGTFRNTAIDQVNTVSQDFTVSPGPSNADVLAAINAEAAQDAAVLAAVNAAIAPPFQVNYFAGADGSRPDQTVRISNTGATQIGTGAAATKADICANIYVFRADQQLAECCSCLVTPNGLRTLSVDFDLTRNPLTPGTIGEGVIKIISSVAGPTHDPANSCTPSTAATFATPGGTYRAWAVHNQDVSSAGNLSGPGVINQVTETPFLGSPLGAIELADIQRNCGFIISQGSTHGVCSCGRGD